MNTNSGGSSDNSSDNDHNEMSAPEAQQVIHEALVRKDDVWPWWQTLRIPFLLGMAATVATSVATLILAVTLNQFLHDRNEKNERDTCYNLFTGASSEAVAEVRSASLQLDAVGWAVLIEAASNDGAESVAPENVQMLDDALRRASDAIELDRQRLEERSQWVIDGRPLPCPLTPGGALLSMGDE